MSTKSELRRQLKIARLSMTDAEHTLKSRAIIDRLKEAIDWSKVKSLHYFEPLKELLEPDISGFVVWLEDNYPDLCLYTPRKIGDEWEMVSVKGKGPSPNQFDVILVPMLGFDPKTRHRIGYGGGYYDKFLATQSDAQKIGICFEGGQVQRLLAENYDVALDKIVTDSSVY